MLRGSPVVAASSSDIPSRRPGGAEKLRGPDRRSESLSDGAGSDTQTVLIGTQRLLQLSKAIQIIR